MMRNIILLWSLSISSCLEITSFSDPLTVTKEGESLELFCSSSDPYQWCYWSHGSDEYLTTGSEEIIENTRGGFTWIKTETSCGLRVDRIRPEFEGAWKCLLANTNAVNVDSIRDERLIEVFVGKEANVNIIAPVPMIVKLGEDLEVQCVIKEQGKPSPSVSIFYVGSETERQKISSGESSTVIYSPSLEDNGGSFTCEWSQEGPDGNILYSGTEISSQVLEVVMPPVINQDDIELTKEYSPGMSLVVPFMAKPWPQEGDITWSLVCSEGNISHTEQLGHNMAMGHFVVEYLKLAQDIGEISHSMYNLETVLYIHQLQDNITIIVNIANNVGATKLIFEVFLPTPTTTPEPSTTTPVTQEPTTIIIATSEQYTNTTQNITELPMPLPMKTTIGAKMELISIIALIGGILLGIFLIIAGFVCFRQKTSKFVPKTIYTEKNNRDSGFFPSEKGEPLLISASVLTNLQPDTERLKTGETMKTFKPNFVDASPTKQDREKAIYAYLGKDKLVGPDTVDFRNKIEKSIKREPNSVGMSSFSDSTDDISSMGVHVNRCHSTKQMSDPLSSWDDLESELHKRRSLNLDTRAKKRTQRKSLNIPVANKRRSDISLTGPTGYPVLLPNLPQSPGITGQQKLHYHFPEGHERRL